MSTEFNYGTGRRKRATARTRLYPGSGQIIVNDRPFEEYFPRKTLQMIIRQPLGLTKMLDRFDIKVTVAGGGVFYPAHGQQHHGAKAATRARVSV